MSAGTVSSTRLRRLAQSAGRPSASSEPEFETCDLCSAPIPPDHRHLLDLRSRQLMCACTPCRLLFDREAAGGDHYRLIPDRRLRLDDFELDDALWASLRIPVDMAFFFPNSAAERVMAFYPGPMGATESLLELEAWEQLEEANPVLRELQPDVEALLVNRAQGAPSYWLVPIDDCYRLVAVIRTRWKGLAGGREVWEEIGRFFAQLGDAARPMSKDGDRQPSPPASAGGGEEAAWRPT